MKPFFALILLISTSCFAQDACNQLNFLNIQYSPFTDTVIVVTVENNSSELFDYPGFVILTGSGDTLAKEMVNYFGIGTQSVHLLDVRPGVHVPSENFTGELQLWTGFYDSQACTWPLDASLCANEPCDSLIISLQNWGGALVLGDFAWSVLDSTDNVVESGTFNMDVQPQYWQHGLCLTPGEYSYTLLALGEPSGGGPTMTVTSTWWYGSPTNVQYFNWTESNVMPVSFHVHCLGNEGPNGIANYNERDELLVLRQANQLTLQSVANIRSVELVSMDGKTLGSFVCKTTQFLMPTLASGIYMVKVMTDANTIIRKIAVL